MKWNTLLLPLVLALTSCSLQSENAPTTTEAARAQLKAGAMLVDVRTPEEFAAQPLSGALNIPVDTIKDAISNSVTNKSLVILLHCRSGRRSAIAETELRSLGYTNAFNIGSFEQAEKIVAGGAK